MLNCPISVSFCIVFFSFVAGVSDFSLCGLPISRITRSAASFCMSVRLSVHCPSDVRALTEKRKGHKKLNVSLHRRNNLTSF